MKVIRLCREKDLHVDEIAEELMVSPKRVLKALHFLEEGGLLEKVDEYSYGIWWCHEREGAILREG